MIFKTMAARRAIALSLVGVHLVLSGAAVPHCHASAVAAGSERGTGHDRHGHHPHRHWAWHTRGHGGSGHSHESPQGGGRHPAASRPAPVDHDQDAVYVADIFLAAEATPPGLGSQPAAGWVMMPAHAWPGSLLTRCQRSRGTGPPGDWPPAHHRLLPHVLRI